MATGINAPDSWEDDQNTGDGLSNDLAELNVNAKPFVPNVNAAAFVPSFMKKTPEVPTAATHSPEPAATEPPKEADDETADGSWEEQGELAVEEETTNEHEEEIVEEKPEKEKPKDNKKNGIVKEDKLPKKVDIEEEDKKEHYNVVFIGHVDAGKSTIGGHLMYLTGQVDKRTLEKYEREAKEKNRETWYLSWALDTNLEERDKGKTVEVGRAYFDTPSKHFVLLDAPGHKSFVPNMIGGAAQADLGVLVISARKGEFETGFERGGQTREHAMLIKTAGIKHLVILVNKMDDPTVNWEEERYKEIETKLNPFLKKVGFRPGDMYYMPCSGFTGANLKHTIDPNICSWYKGPTFLDYLDKLPNFIRPYDGPLRILVSERYKDMGTIVIGKVESGTVKRGETYTLLPNKNNVKVMNIIGPDEQEKNSSRAGENVKLKLSGVEEDDVVPGFVICSPDDVCSAGRLFDAQVVILEHKSIICPGYGGILHVHNAVEEVTLVALIATIDKKTGEKSKNRPRFVKQDTVCIARFQTASKVCIEPFSKFQPMGRFTLRDEGRTIAIGKVLKLIEKKDKASA